MSSWTWNPPTHTHNHIVSWLRAVCGHKKTSDRCNIIAADEQDSWGSPTPTYIHTLREEEEEEEFETATSTERQHLDPGVLWSSDNDDDDDDSCIELEINTVLFCCCCCFRKLFSFAGSCFMGGGGTANFVQFFSLWRSAAAARPPPGIPFTCVAIIANSSFYCLEQVSPILLKNIRLQHHGTIKNKNKKMMMKLRTDSQREEKKNQKECEWGPSWECKIFAITKLQATHNSQDYRHHSSRAQGFWI